MGVLDLVRNAFRSPADRRLYAAQQAAELWQSAPAPSRQLARHVSAPDIRVGPDGFGPPQGPPKSPSINWWQDQPPPPPSRFASVAGYTDHTYQNFSAPLAFEGFGLDAIRAAVARHRLGYFWESSTLMVAILSFAPVLAALQQAIAPILALARHVHGGEKGLAKLIAAEVEEMLIPRDGLLPSPYFPPQLWGSTAIYLRMLGFAVWQHIDGEPDEYTGIRPRYTRMWEPWGVNMYRSPRKVIALTTEGPVEIKNDGKFTLVADENEPHLTAAICALGDETLGGKITQEARNSFLDFFGKPKLYATMPEKVATGDAAGQQFQDAVETIYSPDGRGVLPYGAKLAAVGIPGEGASAWSPALLDAIIHIFMVLTGSAGTIGNGMNTGAGPQYQPAKGGAWNVAHTLIARPTIAMVRATNQGHIAPYVDINYGDAVEGARRAGTWKNPVLEVPLPAPDRDDRIASEIVRYKALTDQVTAERAAGGIVDQDRVDKLADAFEVKGFVLADADPKVGEIQEWHVKNKLVAPDEARARIGLPELPDGVGGLVRLAEERMAGGDQVGELAKVEAAEAKDTGEAEDAASQAAKGDEDALSVAPASASPASASASTSEEDNGPSTQRSAGSTGKAPSAPKDKR